MANILDLKRLLFKSVNKFSAVNTYWEGYLQRDPFLKNAFITVDLVFGNGKHIRISTDPVSVTDEDGNIINYEPFLQEQPTITSQYSIGEGQPSQRTMTITLYGQDIDCISMILNGEFITGIAEVSLQVTGGNFENRLVIIRGDMVGGVNFGTDKEMIELQISDPSSSIDKIIPEPIITEKDFPELPDDNKGKRFAIIKDKCSSGVECIKTSSYTWGANFIIGLGHDLEVTEVLLNGISVPSNDLQRGWSVEEGMTGSGIPYTYLDFVFPAETVEGAFGVTTVVQGQEWSSGDSVYARVDNRKNRGIIPLIREILIEGTNFGIDIIDEELFARSESKIPFLSGNILVNGSDSGNTAKAIEYVQSTVLESFPMLSLVYSARGIGLIATDRKSELYISSYIVGQEFIFDRSTGIQETSREEIYNSFTLRYDYDSATDTYRKLITRDRTNNTLCKISDDRLGRKDYDPVDSVLIENDSTAEFVIEWMVNHFSLPSYYVEYECSPTMFFKVKLGDNIKITDNELGFQDELCTIEKIEFEKGKVTIGVRFWILYDKVARSA